LFVQSSTTFKLPVLSRRVERISAVTALLQNVRLRNISSAVFIQLKWATVGSDLTTSDVTLSNMFVSGVDQTEPVIILGNLGDGTSLSFGLLRISRLIPEAFHEGAAKDNANAHTCEIRPQEV
jgi:hypothetical protein